MSERDNYINIAKKLVSILADLEKEGDWDSTLFLRTAGKKIANLKGEAQGALDALIEESQQRKLGPLRKNTTMHPAYVSVYQTDPDNLEKWEGTLRGIKTYSISRPIYEEEEHVRTLIRAKQDPHKEGYVKVMLSDADIIKATTGKVEFDNYGNKLLTVREGSVKADNIVLFVHGKNVYEYEEGKLILVRTLNNQGNPESE